MGQKYSGFKYMDIQTNIPPGIQEKLDNDAEVAVVKKKAGTSYMKR